MSRTGNVVINHSDTTTVPVNPYSVTTTNSATGKCGEFSETLAPGESIQDVDSAIQNSIVGRITHPEMGIPLAESTPRNHQQVMPDRLRDKVRAVGPGGLRKDVKGPLGADKLEPLAQPVD